MRGSLNLKLVSIGNSQNHNSQIIENEVVLTVIKFLVLWINMAATLASQILVVVFVITLLISRD